VKQVLFERGLLDPAMMKNYSLDGKVVDGVLDERTSLRVMLGNCDDFRDEVTAMAELMKALGHDMEQTPRKHPELAGCGFEYSWRKSKLHFCRNNDFNGNAKSLEARVHAALSTTEVLTLARVRKFHRRANEYKRAYRDLESGNAAETFSAAEGGVAHKDIEDMKKQVKAHRCTLDQDRSFFDKS
jgi:gamma-glutamyl:cysteine ligase YbdK (ATP-grasp superfamily)